MNVATPTAGVPAPDALTVSDLSKRYRGGLLANDQITLTIPSGQVFGLLGPNGAGKTTLVKQIIGLLKPTGGTIRLNGHDLVALGVPQGPEIGRLLESLREMQATGEVASKEAAIAFVQAQVPGRDVQDAEATQR